MDIVFLMYEQMTALDMVGPYQVLATLSDATIHLAAERPGSLRTDTGLSLVADEALADISAASIIVVPGSTNLQKVLDRSSAEVRWLQRVAPSAEWITSVCSGSLMLGSADLLLGKRATTHWLARELLATLGATYQPGRVVVDGNLVTSGGVSAGIDMALQLVNLERGPLEAQTTQLRIEYDPAPPFDAGSPDRAPPEVVARARAVLLARAVVPASPSPDQE